MSAPAVGRVMGGAPEQGKNSANKINIGEMTFGGRFFVNVVSLRYIGMIYISSFR